MSEKLKFAFYWAATCGGCGVAVLDTDEKILEVAEIADIVLWPIATDFKYKDVEEMEDKSIDVAFYNGAVRNEENEHLAKLLRQKSKVLVAFGACSCFGGIPGLANMSDRKGVFERVYKETQSTENPDFVTPQTSTQVAEGELTLPEFFDTVKALDQVVEVDYYLPGCPPPVPLIANAIDAIASGNLPPKGSTLAPTKTVCDECPKTKEEKKIKEIKRPHEVIVDPEKCLLEQGILCAGVATRAGCEAACPSVNMPCRGCMGPTDGVEDIGAKLLSAIASILNPVGEDIEEVIKRIPDPVGTFYRFSLPVGYINRKIMKEEE